jgi:hypothetical protein
MALQSSNALKNIERAFSLYDTSHCQISLELIENQWDPSELHQIFSLLCLCPKWWHSTHQNVKYHCSWPHIRFWSISAVPKILVYNISVQYLGSNIIWTPNQLGETWPGLKNTDVYRLNWQTIVFNLCSLRMSIALIDRPSSLISAAFRSL